MPGCCSSVVLGIGTWIFFVFRSNFACRFAVKCFHLNINKSNLKRCFQILFESSRLPLFLMLWLSFLNITHHFCLCFTVYTFFPSSPPIPLPRYIFVCFIFSLPHRCATSLSLSFASSRLSCFLSLLFRSLWLTRPQPSALPTFLT